jgi:hypothetical protein
LKTAPILIEEIGNGKDEADSMMVAIENAAA